MLKPMLVLCLLLGLFACGAGPAAAASSPAPFASSKDCFAAWPTYDAFIASIRAKNPRWNPKALLLPLAFPREDFERALASLECRGITYENDGLTIHGWMVMPKGGTKKLPVLIYNRGGNGSFGAVTFAHLMQGLFPYAQEGFLVLATQYRGVYDAEPETYGTDQFGGDDVRDVTRLVELVARIPRADPDNIFMLGASRGAMMGFMAARRTDRIRAMAVIAGVSDLRAQLRTRPEMERMYAARMPGYAANRQRLLAERSVLEWADELPPRMPLLILHGSDDERVHVSSAHALHARLEALHRPNRLVVYEGDDHMLSGNRDESRAEVVRWFRAAMVAGGRGAATPAKPPGKAAVPRR